MARFRFTQVDVFPSGPFSGNPVAVVHDADELTGEQMQAVARWTNLSETTFLLTPTEPAADYRLRIFTPGGELPFAGHPTLGSAHAWLSAGGAPQTDGVAIQECGVGLIEVQTGDTRYAFAAPSLLRSGVVDADDRARALAALGVAEDEVGAVEWLDNGPPWIGVSLASAARVLAIDVDYAALGTLTVGVIGAHDPNGPADFEVRAFGADFGEDPVTGSLNAGFALAMYGDGRVVEPSVSVRQGTRLGAAGDVSWSRDDEGRVWIGGAATSVVTGHIEV